jgi:hypothetical protein
LKLPEKPRSPQFTRSAPTPARVQGATSEQYRALAFNHHQRDSLLISNLSQHSEQPHQRHNLATVLRLRHNLAFDSTIRTKDSAKHTISNTRCSTASSNSRHGPQPKLRATQIISQRHATESTPNRSSTSSHGKRSKSSTDVKPRRAIQIIDQPTK